MQTVAKCHELLEHVTLYKIIIINIVIVIIIIIIIIISIIINNIPLGYKETVETFGFWFC